MTPRGGNTMRAPHKQPKSHPFRRHVPTTKENEADEWFVVTHAQIIAYTGGVRLAGEGGGGK